MTGRILAAAAGGAISEGERLLLRLLAKARIQGWESNFGVYAGGGYRVVDVGFPAQKLAIEVDGFAFHSSDVRFADDRRRQNALVSAGWTVLRFTWWQLVNSPDEVLRVIEQNLRRLEV